MRFMQFFVAFALVGSLSAVADNKPRLSAAGKIDRSPIAASSDYPSGVWVTDTYNEKVVRITRRGHVRTNIALVTNNGVQANLDFPRRLRHRASRDYYYTTGSVGLTWWTGFGYINCQYPVRFEAKQFRNDLEVEISYPAQLGVDAYGRCFHFGTNRQVFDMVRE